jgi:hypothetical protein
MQSSICKCALPGDGLMCAASRAARCSSSHAPSMRNAAPILCATPKSPRAGFNLHLGCDVRGSPNVPCFSYLLRMPSFYLAREAVLTSSCFRSSSWAAASDSAARRSAAMVRLAAASSESACCLSVASAVT